MRYFEKQALEGQDYIDDLRYKEKLKASKRPWSADRRHGGVFAIKQTESVPQVDSTISSTSETGSKSKPKSSTTGGGRKVSGAAKFKMNPWVKGGLIGAGVVGTAAIVSSLTSKPSRVW